MSNFPTDFDDDTSLPVVNDNITEIGSDAINALRDAVFNIEIYLGLGADGYSYSSVANRLGVSLNPDGTIKASAIASLGLISGAVGIYDADVNPNAAIIETKLKLDHRTQDLYNYIRDLAGDINIGIGWVSTIGSKLQPHLLGAIYRHTLDQIDVIADPGLYLQNKFRTTRDNSDSYQLVNDINNELLQHQWADGSLINNIQDVITNNGSIYPSNFAHTAGGIFLNTDRFSTIPQTADDLQAFAEFLDSSSIFLYGTRIQNLYSNGVSKVSRSSSLSIDGYGPALIPPTSVIAYLLDGDVTSSPFDDIDAGDDIVEFKPSASDRTTYSFDEKFALVRPGDIIRVNYGTIEVAFIIKEKKYQSDTDPLNNRYLVRIAGKNLSYAPTATARIDKSLVNGNKFGVLSLAAAQIADSNSNVLGEVPSLIVGTPRGAMCLGLGFNPAQFDSTHYLLYLALYPTGHPQDGYVILPGIDVTGDAGETSGKYTIDSIVQATNNAFRQPGYNYRFTAFSYKGEFGIMLADSYNNAAFSIVSAAVATNGTYDELATNVSLPNNVVGIFADTGVTPPDPLGFGNNGSAVASPPFMTTYGSSEAALLPTKLFTALKRNNYYIDGTERDKLNLDVEQLLDGYGDGYWPATVQNKTIIPGSPPAGRVQTTYRIPLDLSASNLKVGKTLVVQASAGAGGLIDAGRFVIEDIAFTCSPNEYTDITVYDAVHGASFSPTTTLDIGSEVAIYFNSDSVSFNAETATDFVFRANFKRHFEVYVDSEGNTFTHERGRFFLGGDSSVININGTDLINTLSDNNFDIVKISPKLKGYQFGNIVKISLHLTTYDSTTGLVDGYLASSADGTAFDKAGPLVHGRLGEVIRFYDESNIDYIDVIFNINLGNFAFSDVCTDFQLFPTLALDDQIMMIGTCQVNTSNNIVNQIRDERQFGNTSEKEFSTSALDFISAPEKLLHANGVIGGFDLSTSTGTTSGQINLTGGTAVVNGRFIQMNPQTVTIPPIVESNNGLFIVNWALCINDNSEYQLIPLLDKFNMVSSNSGISGSTERVFRALNIVSSMFYTLDASTFANIINNRKDLTILYVVLSSVSNPGPTYSLTISDARKFAYNETQNMTLTWTPDDQNMGGHFKSLNSIITWSNMYDSSNNVIKVKGIFNLGDSETLDLSSVRNRLIFEGDGAVFNITAAQGIIVKENVTFENIVFNYDPTDFEQNGNINGANGCIFGYAVTGDFLSNITINNCKFFSSTAVRPPFISLNFGITTYISNVNICGNQFDDTVTDYASAIAFINNDGGGEFDPFRLPTLADILIENNICNQSQALYFANNTAGDMFDSMIPINVKVLNNKLGYIGYGFQTFSAQNQNFKDEGNSFTVDGNNCIAIISPVDLTGKFPSNFTSLFPMTGNVTINNNILNFIVICAANDINSGTDGRTETIISNNKLNAFDFTNTVKAIFNFDTSQISSTIESEQPIAIAVLEAGGSPVATVPNVLIHNNMICKNTVGILLVDRATYQYAGGIYCGPAATIIGNHISGLQEFNSDATPKTFGIIVSGISSVDGKIHIIKQNIIFREDISIRSYVECLPLSSFFGAGGGNAEVIDNYFDSPYIDSGNTDPATILINDNDARVYGNKNYIKTKCLRAQESGQLVGHSSGLTPSSRFVPPGFGTSFSTYTISYGRTPEFGVSGIDFGQLAMFLPAGGSISWVIPLDFIPIGGKLIDVSIDYRIDEGSAGTKNLNAYILTRRDTEALDDTVIYQSLFSTTSAILVSGELSLTLSPPAVVNNKSDSMRYYLQIYIDNGGGNTGKMDLGQLRISYHE